MTEYIEKQAMLEDFERCNRNNPEWTPQRVKTLIVRQQTADKEEKMIKTDFTEDWDKMCKVVQLQDACCDCKLSCMNNRFSYPCDKFVKECPEEALEIINEWIKENENGRS